jgi:hypothetical protein
MNDDTFALVALRNEVERLRAELAADAPKGTARHIKRGTTYDVIGEAYIQTDKPLEDMMKVVIYRCHEDGQLWARRLAEFYDGRFEIPARIDAALNKKGE